MSKKKTAEDLTYVQKLYKARTLMDEGVAPNDPDFQTNFPTLFELLTDGDLGEEGKVDTGAIRIVNSVGEWHFSISSPGMGGFCEVAVPHAKDGFQALEEKARRGPAVWTFWRKSRLKVRKNGKSSDEG